MTVNLGPIRPGMDGFNPTVSNITAYNPRSLRRDVSGWPLQKWCTAESLLNVTVGTASKTIASFQDELQGRFGDGFLGMHAAGHYAMGGDASDFYSSLNDPAFWLHHAMVDRVWWIWQMLHPDQARTVAGTLTLGNNPPSRNGTIDDYLEVPYLIEPVVLKNVFNTLGGAPLCYIYV